TVSAGDTIGASPLISANYLDEPTIEAMNRLGLEFDSVGNHEFDRGADELKRMQAGGCAKFTRRTPCAVERFRGARFQYLAANVVEANGKTIFPATAIKSFQTSAGTITIGFIGETLKGTANIVTPSGVKGLVFKDEADTANRLVPMLKAEGADAILLLIHQGGKTSEFTVGNNCTGFTGEILPIVQRLDPAIATVVSGHTHWAYICRSPQQAGAGRLLTSAGKYGYFITDLRLKFDPVTHHLVSQDAHNIVVGKDERSDNADIRKLVARYASAVAPIANRIIGHLTAPAMNAQDDGESPAADLIADSMLAATRAKENGGAQLALLNSTGVRVPLPSGDVKYASAFEMMPFGNSLVVMTLTGAQLKGVIEQQYSGTRPPPGQRPHALATSNGFTYAVDMREAPGRRVFDCRLNGRPIDPAERYRVAVNNYLASGGDGLTFFTQGTDITDRQILDLDALVAWISPGRTPPRADRILIVT
ncbi:MAG TPA: bifunctional metallophosphatase/5'-nucleotidase, partial [Sphingomicrobium sp.]|nr:bifunctional metallophosphatase/5'-nucleotidase [Sphingomicrobium sp.]